MPKRLPNVCLLPRRSAEAKRTLLVAAGLLVGLSILGGGCATPMTMRDIRAVKPHCARIDRQIATLEKEKAENNQRLLAGVQSVAPALAALNLVAGTYGRNVAIATGEWAATIDAKLVELRRARKKC
jgi:hypothetical protein